MKAVVAAFNQEKALVGAFSVITNLRMQLGCNFLEHYLAPHAGRAHQVVRVGARRRRCLPRLGRHAADHDDGGAAVAADLHPGERLLVRGGPLALQRPRTSALDSDVVLYLYISAKYSYFI